MSLMLISVYSNLGSGVSKQKPLISLHMNIASFARMVLFHMNFDVVMSAVLIVSS